ncbi:hypothetical protein ACOSP7_012372 [Xanthoceras sorbifolium]
MMNPDEISRRCANLSLSEEDGPVAKIDGDHHEKGVMNVSMSLIGKILAYKEVNRHGFKAMIPKPLGCSVVRRPASRALHVKFSALIVSSRVPSTVQAVRPSQSAKQESEFVEKSETMRPMGGEELLIPEDAQAPSLSCGQEEKILVLVRL